MAATQDVQFLNRLLNRLTEWFQKISAIPCVYWPEKKFGYPELLDFLGNRIYPLKVHALMNNLKGIEKKKPFKSYDLKGFNQICC